MRVKCFLITPTLHAQLALRRYWKPVAGDAASCAHYHNAETPVGRGTYTRDTDGYFNLVDEVGTAEDRWPTACDKCGAPVPDDAEKQLFADHVWISASGEEYSQQRDRVPGMMWNAWWAGEWARGPDGQCLCVILPDGFEWMIDGPASNCTMPDDRGPFDKAHRCWVRHGEPPNLVVDKNGRTCAAGAGSIQSRRSYHGFLGTNGAAPGEFT